jgi:type II secretory ATPase GspE/PulE/Tfp pilus assembly ATPase PilB-like protein
MIGEIRDFETAQIALQAAQTGHLVLASVHTNNSVATISRLHHLGCEKDVLANSLLLITAQRLVRKICQHCLLASQPCNYCSNVGYIGRMAIHEVMPFDFTIRQLIQDGKHLYKALSHAKDLGMLDLWSQGLSRVAQGLTSQQEIIAKIGQIL